MDENTRWLVLFVAGTLVGALVDWLLRRRKGTAPTSAVPASPARPSRVPYGIVDHDLTVDPQRLPAGVLRWRVKLSTIARPKMILSFADRTELWRAHADGKVLVPAELLSVLWRGRRGAMPGVDRFPRTPQGMEIGA